MQHSDIVDVVGLAPHQSHAASSSEALEGDEAVGSPSDTGRIRCVCANEEDDGFTIQCDNCLVWQHAGCVGIARSTIPETYLCEQCRPEEVDVEATGTFPKRRRQQQPLQQYTGRENGLPTMSEISENIISVGLAEMGELLMVKGGEEKEKEIREGHNHQHDHSHQHDQNPPHGYAQNSPSSLNTNPPDAGFPSKDMGEEGLGKNNFSLLSTVTFPSLAELRNSSKMVELRELRPRHMGRRNGNIPRVGVFAVEDIDPGTLIGEYVGHVQLVGNLARLTTTETVTQSFVLFCKQTPGVVVDARRFGNHLRYVRRSCRANCEIKLVLTPDEDPVKGAHWCLFARNTIRENEELFLSFDYHDGNHFFCYECACAYPELCLAEEMPLPGHPHHHHPIPDNNTINSTVTARKRREPEKKLSREERKLQQYIEFFERMESSERKHAQRVAQRNQTGSTSASLSASGSVSTSGSTVASGSTSPKGSLRKTPNKPPTRSASPPFANPIEKDREEDHFSPSSINVTPTTTSSTPLAQTPSSPTRRTLPLKKFLSKTFSDKIKQHGGMSETEATSKSTSESGTSEVIVPIISNPDTPSKRRVSLSDYMMRRKSSPQGQSTTSTISHTSPTDSNHIPEKISTTRTDSGIMPTQKSPIAHAESGHFYEQNHPHHYHSAISTAQHRSMSPSPLQQGDGEGGSYVRMTSQSYPLTLFGNGRRPKVEPSDTNDHANIAGGQGNASKAEGRLYYHS